MHASQLCQLGVGGAAGSAAPTLDLSRMLPVTSFMRFELATHEWLLGRMWGSGRCRANACARPREFLLSLLLRSVSPLPFRFSLGLVLFNIPERRLVCVGSKRGSLAEWVVAGGSR